IIPQLALMSLAAGLNRPQLGNRGGGLLLLARQHQPPGPELTPAPAAPPRQTPQPAVQFTARQPTLLALLASLLHQLHFDVTLQRLGAIANQIINQPPQYNRQRQDNAQHQ